MLTDTANSEINRRVKEILRRDLKLGPGAEIEDDMPLIGGEFDIDSLDVVLLVSSIEKEFDIKLPKQAASTEVFRDVGSMVRFLQTQTQGQFDTPTTDPGTRGTGGQDRGEARLCEESTSESGASAGSPDLERLLAGLPHGQPFRFVSQLTSAQPGVQAEGLWRVSGDEAFLGGHFPDQPMVPGVLISEALAQLSGLVQPVEQAGAHHNGQPRSGQAGGEAAGSRRVLAQVNVRFKQPVTPPAKIALHSRLERSMPPMDHFIVHATVNGEVVAEGELTLHAPDARD